MNKRIGYYRNQSSRDIGNMLLNKYTSKRSLMIVKNNFNERENLNKSQKYCRVKLGVLLGHFRQF